MSHNTYALALLDKDLLTIDAGGAIEITQAYHTVAANTSTTDNLDTINFATALTSLLTNSVGVHRPFVILQAAAGHTITLRHAQDNIEFNGAADFELSGNKKILLFFDGTVVTDLGPSGGGGGGAPTTATYITQTPDGTLSNEQALSTLASGLLKNTTTTGVLSIAVPGTDYLAPSVIDTDATLAANSDAKVASQKAIKAYVDAVAQGLSVKYSVVAATTSALPAHTYSNGSSGVGATITATANGALTIDGQAITLNNRVLIKDEPSASHNGIYTCTTLGDGSHTFVLTRTTDMDLASEIPGAFTFVENGTVNDAAGFVVADPGPYTIGTTAISWTQFSGAGQITAGTGLTKTGNTLAIDSTVATLTGAQTLTSKTLTTPTISDLSNAQHTHTNAAGGGQMTDAALSSAVGIAKGGTGQTSKAPAFDALAPGTTQGDLIYHDGTNHVRLPKGTSLQQLRMNSGATAPEWFTDTGGFAPLPLIAKTAAGKISIGGTEYDLATAGNWISGSSEESASEYVKIYRSGSTYKLSEKMPNRPTQAAAVATGQINGSPGLNGTSIVYDGGSGEGSITPGMMIWFYTDSGRTTGRGRGSGASGSVDNLCGALITAINTGTNTITVAAGHNINLTDNDYWSVTPLGAMTYYYDGSTYWEFCGMMFNDASGNLDSSREALGAEVDLDEAVDYTTTSTSFTSVDSTKLAMRIFSRGARIFANFTGVTSTTSSYVYMDFDIDGLGIVERGMASPYLSDGAQVASMSMQKQWRVLPGTHTISLQWRVVSGTGQLFASASSGALYNTHPHMSVREVAL